MPNTTIDQTPPDSGQAEFDADMAYMRRLVDNIDVSLTPPAAEDILAVLEWDAPGCGPYLFNDSDGDWPDDAAADLLEDWRYGPVMAGAYCPCGSRLEIRGELDAEDYEAITEFDYVHQCCTFSQDLDEAEAVAL